MALQRAELQRYLQELFHIDRYRDYGPNGLQVEGREEIEHIAFAVSATRHSIGKACAAGAHALIVHHGLFWKFHPTRPVVGPFAARLKPLIQHDINLFGLHLPLDGHPELGHAAVLAKKLKLQQQAPFGLYEGMPTGVHGRFARAWDPSQLQQHLSTLLQHPVLHAAPDARPLHSLGIITGGANGQWRECLTYQLDAYLTGEMSEHDWHESQEAGIHMFAGGHHATERWGILALKEHLAREFPGLKTEFFDSLNPA